MAVRGVTEGTESMSCAAGAIASAGGAGKILSKAPNRDRRFGGGGLWNTIDEVIDPSVVRQLNSGSCGPSCGAMLLCETDNPAAQSAIALRQGAVMSDDAARLAGAMNDLAGTRGFGRGGFIDVISISKLKQRADVWHATLAVGDSELESDIVVTDDGELQSFHIVEPIFKDVLS